MSSAGLHAYWNVDYPIGHVRPQWMVQIRRYLGFVFTRHCLCHEKSHGETNQCYNAKVSILSTDAFKERAVCTVSTRTPYVVYCTVRTVLVG